jgi:hypothetical protein
METFKVKGKRFNKLSYAHHPVLTTANTANLVSSLFHLILSHVKANPRHLSSSAHLYMFLRDDLSC